MTTCWACKEPSHPANRPGAGASVSAFVASACTRSRFAARAMGLRGRSARSGEDRRATAVATHRSPLLFVRDLSRLRGITQDMPRVGSTLSSERTGHAWWAGLQLETGVPGPRPTRQLAKIGPRTSRLPMADSIERSRSRCELGIEVEVLTEALRKIESSTVVFELQ